MFNNVFDIHIQQGLRDRRRAKKGKKTRIPYHGRRRHMNVNVMGGPSNCVHSLAQHEEINWPFMGDDGQTRTRQQTISYALPCQVKHKSTTKKPKHKDVQGRTW